MRAPEMCNKVYNRVECEKCGYPWCEAAFSDKPVLYGGPLPCDAPQQEIDEWIEECDV